MGRDRKIQTGASNFSAVAAAHAYKHGEDVSSSNDTSTTKSESFRSSTHKLIHSDNVNEEKSEKHSNYRHIKYLSTWRVNQVDPHHHHTEHKQNFTNPADRVHDDSEGKFKEMNGDENRKAIRNQAIEKLMKMAKLRFGNTANMFRAFKKKGGDPISFLEFVENIRKRSLETEFEVDDIKLIFETFDTRNESVIPVNSVIRKVEELECLDSVAKRDMLEIRAFLADQLEKRRNESVGGAADGGVDGSPEFKGDIKKSKTIRTQGLGNTEELMKKAIGQRTFDLEVGTEELDKVLDEVFHKKHTQESHGKFARFLRLTNLKLNHVPFYTMRTTELDNLKHRVSSLESQCTDPELLNRLTELTEKRRQLLSQPKLSTEPDINIEGVTRTQSTTTLVSVTDEDSAQYQLPPPTIATSPIKPSKNRSLSGRLDPIQQAPQHSHRERTMSVTGLSVTTPTGVTKAALGSDDSEDNSHAIGASSARYAPALEKDLVFEDRTESSATDFMETSMQSPFKIQQNTSSIMFANSNNNNSNGNLAWAASVVSMEDKRRMGMSMGYIDPKVERVDRNRSMSSDYFAPLKYEPSKPVTRDFEPDANRDFRQREERRQKRYERTAANLHVTKERIEYESLKSTMQEMRAQQFRNEDMIRYQTAIFLNDMKCFKKQPLQVMAKKPDFTKADAMWGGSMRLTSESIDTRDFSTTYKKSFNTDGSKASLDTVR